MNGKALFAILNCKAKGVFIFKNFNKYLFFNYFMHCIFNIYVCLIVN